MMIRGLFADWKQPIYAGFDVNMSLNLLNEAMSKVYAVGFEVVATTSDCGGANVIIWHKIDLSKEITYILHPVTQRKVFLFADAPHILKLVRNWLIDNGFTLPDGSTITHAPLWDLVTKKNTEVSGTFFLREEHLNCYRNQRQNVAYAAKLLSRKCSFALQRKVNTPEAKRLADFILKVNGWWDIFNSRYPNESQVLKRPYGMNIEEQNEVLQEIEEFMKTAIPTRKTCMQVYNISSRLIKSQILSRCLYFCSYFKNRC